VPALKLAKDLRLKAANEFEEGEVDAEYLMDQFLANCAKVAALEEKATRTFNPPAQPEPAARTHTGEYDNKCNKGAECEHTCCCYEHTAKQRRTRALDGKVTFCGGENADADPEYACVGITKCYGFHCQRPTTRQLSTAFCNEAYRNRTWPIEAQRVKDLTARTQAAIKAKAAARA
jgi:hypothetical protein